MDETATKLDELLDMDRLEGAGALATPEELDRWDADRDHDRRESLLRSSGIHDVLSTRAERRLLRGELDDTRALHWVRTWLKGQVPILGLFGPTDAGKTMAAAWALSERAGRYHTAADLCRERRASFGGPTAAYHAARVCALLVVDELGGEDDEAKAALTLEEILNFRQKLSRRTLLIGNIDQATFVQRYGERTFSRLQGVGRSFRVDKCGYRARREG